MSIEVVAACLLDAGHVLAVERAGGGWEFPGGKVEPGEDHTAALRRELKEELSVEVEGLRHLVTVEHAYPDFDVQLDCYLARPAGPFTLSEHRSSRWLTRATLDELDWLEADRLVLDSVRGHLVPADPPAGDDRGPFYHGTKAVLAPGGELTAGHQSNFGAGHAAGYVYFTATLDAATWGAELAAGDGPGRIYRVEPLGEFGHDPNLTNHRFPGNPTRSYRSQSPLRVIGEVVGWTPHPPDVLAAMRANVADLKRRGVEADD